MRHRDAWAEEKRAPSEAEWARENAEREAAKPAVSSAPRADSSPSSSAPVELHDENLPHDILVVVSKLKAYVRARSGMNTSDSVMEVLSERLRRLCDEGIRSAADDGRKTVMDRDFR